MQAFILSKHTAMGTSLATLARSAKTDSTLHLHPAAPSYTQLREQCSLAGMHSVKARHSASLTSYGVGWTMTVVTLGLRLRSSEWASTNALA